MLGILKSFSTLIVSIFQFLTHSIATMLKVFTAIPRFITYVTSVITVVIPTEMVAFLLLALTCMLMMVIIGRNG